MNPGAIANELVNMNQTAKLEMLWPGMYIFDSLQSHDRYCVSENVRKWLNWECKRLFFLDNNSLSEPLTSHLKGKSDYDMYCAKYPFTEKSMQVRSPTGMYNTFE